MRVEEALRLLPNIDAVAPLRAVLLASAQQPGNNWGSAAPYQTIGKRDVDPGEMRRELDVVMPRLRDHVTGLWSRYVAALELVDAGDPAQAVTELLSNGRAEQELGRLAQALGWYRSARVLAEGLHDRHPEIAALLSLGQLALYMGSYEDSARDYQRALVIAESEFDQASSVRAAKGLGDVAVERGAWAGAQAWYARALRLAESASDLGQVGGIQHARGELARRRGDPGGTTDALRVARECFEATGDAHEIARVLATQGLADAQFGLPSRAAAALLEALAWSRRGPPDRGLDAFIRLQIARVFVEQRRFLEAEQELRRAEALAISFSMPHRLAQVYSLFGKLRGLQGEETGFVFFEQALQLSAMIERWPLVEAQVRHEYGLFKQQFGHVDEARAHLERAQEIFASLGAVAELERVRSELKVVSA